MASSTTPKGQRRRAQLITAAADLLYEEGIEAVRHRAVADRAGSSLAATTYYFTDLSDLVYSAVEELTHRELNMLRQHVEKLNPEMGPSDVAEVLLGALLGQELDDPREDRRTIMLRYERLVGTGRRPYLAGLMDRLMSELEELLLELFVRVGTPRTISEIRRIVMQVDGAAVNALIMAEPDPRKVARNVARTVVG